MYIVQIHCATADDHVSEKINAVLRTFAVCNFQMSMTCMNSLSCSWPRCRKNPQRNNLDTNLLLWWWVSVSGWVNKAWEEQELNMRGGGEGSFLFEYERRLRMYMVVIWKLKRLIFRDHDWQNWSGSRAPKSPRKKTSRIWRYEEVNPLEEHTNTPYLSLRVSCSPAYDKKALKIRSKKASDKAALFPRCTKG